MKSLKKILSIFAAFMMVVGLTAANVKADATGTITINEAKKLEYTAYRLLDVTVATENTENEDGSTIENVTSTVYVANDVQYQYLNQSGTPFTFKKNTNGTWNVTLNGSASDVVKYVQAHNPKDFNTTDNKKLESVELKKENGTASVSNVPLGYYYITSGTGSVGMLDTAGKNLIIEDKNNIDFTKTSNGAETVKDKNVGDLVDFTITFKAYAGWKNVVVSDSTTKGLEIVKNGNKPKVLINSDLNYVPYPVTISNVEKVNDEGKYKDGDTFTITFPEITEDQTFTITYQARVTEDAAYDNTAENKATLSETNNPNIGEDNVTVYVYDFDLVKTDSNSQKLENAEFELYKSKKSDNEKDVIDEDNIINFVEKNGIYTVASASQLADNSIEKVTTINAGKVRIEGLGNGTYFLKEIKAPDGYNALTEPKEVVISDADKNAVMTNDTYVSGGVQVINNTGSTLPSTGGMGTTMIYIAGAILMVGAAIIFVTNKRMKHE